MFLHGEGGEEVSPYTAQVVEQVLYLLWDIGFKVGHSTRSLDEAITQANRDMLTKTALLESRFLTDHPELSRLFRDRFRAECVEGHEPEFVALRMQDQAARHAKFGNSVYMQEPHVKSGCGGLRDYQNLLWITAFKQGRLRSSHLSGKDWLSPGDQTRIETAYDFLLRVRNELHYANGRATDVLHLNFQQHVARRLGYSAKNPAVLSEAFMKDYYEHTRNIFRVTQRITEQFATGRFSAEASRFLGTAPTAPVAEEDLGKFIARGGQIFVKDQSLFQHDPFAVMEEFEAV